MARKHALLISLVIAGALVAGVSAALRTTELGASATAAEVSDRQLRIRDRELDRIGKQIRAQRRKRPPALPELRVPASSSGSLASIPAQSVASPPSVLASNSGPGSVSSGHTEDGGHGDDHGHDDDASGHGRGHGGDNEDGSSGHGRGHGGDDD